MHGAWVLVAVLCALASLPGTLELLLLSLAALGSRRQRRSAAKGELRGRIAVVVPAHDEEASIGECLNSLRVAAEADGDASLVVVADRCTDATAQVAEGLGARVLVHDDPEERGKGFALRFAWQALQPEPVAALAVVDADSVVEANFVREIRLHLHGAADAVQVRNLVRNADASPRTRLLALGLSAMNLLRPLGRERLGLSVGLFGNGFALRRKTLDRVRFSGHAIAEDLDYHIRLVSAGLRSRFVESTAVWSDVATQAREAGSQRARWEGGRLNAVLRWSPRLLRGIAAGQIRLIEPLLDLWLIPLAYHAALLSLLLVLPWTPGRLLGAFGLAVLAFHVVLAAWLAGRLRDLRVLPAAPLYLLWKLGLSRRIVAAARPKADWMRSPRRKDTETDLQS